MQLAAGEQLKVDTGCLVALDLTVDYDIVRVGGIKTSLFGGEGLFSRGAAGPGRVWLQALPFSRLADRINAAKGADRGEVKRDLGGMLGGLGDLIGGDRAWIGLRLPAFGFRPAGGSLVALCAGFADWPV